jgi:hypothetical protein
MLTESKARGIKPRRIARKVFDGAGLYLLVTPKGGRCWRYAYRFAGREKTLSLGIYPDVPVGLARARHQFARNLLAHGIDPSGLKAALGKLTFLAMMREWERVRSSASARLGRNHEPIRVSTHESLSSSGPDNLRDFRAASR